MGAGIYLHIPFCSHACDFCAFFQIEPRRADVDHFLENIGREFELAGPTGPFATAFWGGGTPGLLTARDLERLGRMQLERFGPPTTEWTIELAPSSVRKEKLHVLRDLGISRVSLGVQSLQPRMLDALGRRHSVDQAHRAWEAIEKVGFRSRNIDLIFAIPGQTLEAWLADLEAAVALGPDHLSTYCLTFEEDTALFLRLAQGDLRIDPERERRFYEATWERLQHFGYRQYEISNFARSDHACRHNLNTWRMGDWWGFGPSAASQVAGVRGSNPADLLAWAEGVAQGRRATRETCTLTASQLVEDSIIFGLRMNAGVDLGALGRRFGERAVAAFQPRLEQLIGDGLARRTSARRVALTDAGRILADAVGAEFVGLGATGAV